MIFRYVVKEERNDQRIEQVLREEFAISSHLLKNLKQYGDIMLNGSKRWVVAIVKTGDLLEVSWDFHGKEAGEIVCDSIPILYQDDCFLIVDKPSNLCVHPSKGHGFESLITLLSGENHLHVVTRLDKDTSGLVLLAKNGYWHNQLSNTEIQKRYYGLVEGRPEPSYDRIDAPIQREAEGAMRRMVHPDGKNAITVYQVLEYFPEENQSIVDFQLLTGRCHQIRVHTSYLGHPLVGDCLYGSTVESEGGQKLMCGSLQFLHPRDQTEIAVSVKEYRKMLLA